MVKLNVKIGKLFDFIAEKYNKTFNYDEFVEVPFELKVLNEKNEFSDCKKLAKKKDSLWETKFDNGVSIKTAAKHMVCFVPEEDKHKYTEDIQIGDKLEYLGISVVENKKVEDESDVFGLEIDSDTHLYKDVHGIIHHNTHTVTEAVHAGVEKWSGKAKRPKLVVVHGDVGGALTSLLIFFFINSKNRVLLLDDADAFITNRDGAIQNFLKALLDPDNHAVTSSPTIRQNATHMYQAELANMRMEESETSNRKLISVDISKLNENKVKVTVGKKIIEYTVTSEDEKKLLRENFQPKELTEEHKRLVESTLSVKGIRYNRYGKLVALREGDILDKVNIDDVGEEDAYAEKFKVDLEDDELDNLPEEIPASWYFYSRLVMVSNLSQNDMNEAIRSRCDCRGIYLDKDEFMCRAESILDHLKIGRVSLTEPELIYWAKHESFAVLKACVADMNYKNSKINMKIGIPLELRIIASIAGLLLARYDRWHEANKIEGHDEETLQRFEKEQIAAYIKFDLLPVMAGDKSMG